MEAAEPSSPIRTHSHTENEMKSDVNRIRGYMDLLDDYSLHHFVIWQGKVIRDTPEFASLMRIHQAGWSSIARCISIIEGIMTVNAIPLAVVDGKKFSELARFDVERVDQADLCSCIANLEQIRPLLRHTKLVLKSPSAAQLAAITIQAAGRKFLERSGLILLKRQRHAATEMQRVARGRTCRRQVGAILLARRNEMESKWLQLQQGLKTSWEQWRESERVVVHIPTATSDEYASVNQSQQISRLNWLVDTKVHVVCISRCSTNEDVLDYYRKILEMTGVRHVGARLSAVVPENVDVFPNYMPLVSLLLYSPSCLKRIGQIVKGRPAMIVSGDVDWQMKRLAVALGVPLLSAEPSLASLLRTQSGMKSVFAAADVNAPIGAHDVYDEEDLVVSLTKLIACNLDVQRWYVKVDVCQGSRGLAILDTGALSCMAGLRRERVQLEYANGGGSDVWQHPDVQLLARARLLKTIRSSLHRVILICNREAYPTWARFLENLARVGGIIEAEAPERRGYPAAHLFLSPTGNITDVSQTEMLLDVCHQSVGCLYPQECVSSNALSGASIAIGRELYLRGVMGHISVYFVVFSDDRTRAPRLWATGLELGLSESAFSFCLFRSLTRRSSSRDLGCYTDTFDEESEDQEGKSNVRSPAYVRKST